MAASSQFNPDDWAKNTPPAKYSIVKLLIDSRTSRRQLYRIFHDSVGMPPRKWFKFRRMKLAPEMLRKQEDTVKSISIELGYNDPAQFSRDFKSAHALCPAAFRAKQRETPVQMLLLPESKADLGTHSQHFGTLSQHPALPSPKPQV